MGILDGRVAIVTGASSGVGRACAIRFAEEGAAVVGCARRFDKLQEMVQAVEANGGKALAVACDVAQEVDIDNVVTTTLREFGRIDILVNNAQGGLDNHAGLVDATPQLALEAFTTGPLQYLLFMQKCFPYMQAQHYGRVVNAGSHTSLIGTPGVTSYAMAKGAVMALTRNASQEWGQFGIVTNTFLPAIRNEAGRLSNAFYEQAAQQNPLRRYGTPYDDCAPIVAFLASEGAGYLNGQVIGIDGGRHLIA